MAAIHFFSEETDFVPAQKMAIRQWLRETAQEEGFRIGELNYIFCSDEYLLRINQQYLQHDTLTDIVTFDNSEKADQIAGDVFISIDRVWENAEKYKVKEEEELHRVIIHGLLHLCGYGDKGAAEKKKMTEKEDYFLARRRFSSK